MYNFDLHIFLYSFVADDCLFQWKLTNFKVKNEITFVELQSNLE